MQSSKYITPTRHDIHNLNFSSLSFWDSIFILQAVEIKTERKEEADSISPKMSYHHRKKVAHSTFANDATT